MINKILPLLVFGLLAVFSSSCDDDDLNRIGLDAEVLFTITPEWQIANQHDYLLAEVVLPADYDNVLDNQVDFTIFSEEELHESSSIRLREIGGELKNVAEIRIRSSRATTYKIEARMVIEGVEIIKVDKVQFSKSFPDEIHVTSTSSTIKADSAFSHVTITATGTRVQGQISEGTIIYTTAIDSNLNSIGFFPNYNTATDSSRQVNNIYAIGPIDYVGPITIISVSQNDSGESISDSLTLFTSN